MKKDLLFSSKKPVIGILANFLVMDTGLFPGLERTFVNHDYIQAIVHAGGLPFILPILTDAEILTQQLSLLDGLLLTGGDDIHPHLYGEEPHLHLGAFNHTRDAFECKAIEIGSSYSLPMFGICRGLQILNVALGGTLYQDIPSSHTDALQHWQKAVRSAGTHTVQVKEKSQLHAIVGCTQLVTNSLHHQAIKDLAPGLKVNAHTQDGIIEGIEKEGESFVLAVQWHPECMAHQNSAMQALFDTFVAAAQSYRSLSYARKE